MDIEICQKGSAAPKEMLHGLHDNQAQDARHQCPICAYNAGFEDGSRNNTSELPIDASIFEVDTGIFYRIKLQTIPSIGELIELYSYSEALDRKHPMRYYEVTQVLHHTKETTERASISMKGAQSVRLFVKSSRSPLFEES